MDFWTKFLLLLSRSFSVAERRCLPAALEQHGLVFYLQNGSIEQARSCFTIRLTINNYDYPTNQNPCFFRGGRFVSFHSRLLQEAFRKISACCYFKNCCPRGKTDGCREKHRDERKTGPCGKRVCHSD